MINSVPPLDSLPRDSRDLPGVDLDPNNSIFLLLEPLETP